MFRRSLSSAVASVVAVIALTGSAFAATDLPESGQSGGSAPIESAEPATPQPTTIEVAPFATETTDEALESPVPTITGSAQVGKTLTVQPGQWSAGTTLSYQWYGNNVAIAGATKSTLVVPGSQVGKQISVAVTGVREGSSPVIQSSVATAAVIAGTLTAPTPTISGTVKVGSKLTAKPGTWTKGTTLKYQWYSNSKAIKGATGSTFTPTASYRDKQIKVTVSGSQTGYTSASKTSKTTAKVAAATLTSTRAAISGKVKVDNKLTAKAGTWTKGTTLKYQWYANNKAIKGATKSTYTIPASLAGQKVRVKITGSKSGYSTLTRTSKASAKIAKGKLSTSRPKISGSSTAGKTLTAKAGTWTKGTKLKYQWYVDTKAIKGATSSTYKVSASMAGREIRVKVTGSKSGYTSVTRTSAVAAKPKLAYKAARGEKWIDVNLSNYTMTAYNGSVVAQGPVSTVIGAPATPTVTGKFRVQTKLRSQTMRGLNADGSKYETEDVPDILYFYQGYALHGAYWRSSFGYAASHGCVNLPLGAAKTLYNWAEVGTVVVVHY